MLCIHTKSKLQIVYFSRQQTHRLHGPADVHAADLGHDVPVENSAEDTARAMQRSLLARNIRVYIRPSAVAVLVHYVLQREIKIRMRGHSDKQAYGIDPNRGTELQASNRLFTIAH